MENCKYCGQHPWVDRVVTVEVKDPKDFLAGYKQCYEDVLKLFNNDYKSVTEEVFHWEMRPYPKS